MAEIVLFSPLFSFFFAAIAVLLNGRIKDFYAKWGTCAFMALGTYAAVTLFINIALKDGVDHVSLWPWIHVDRLRIDFGILLDRTSCTMMAMVSFVSLLIHVYSVGYMSHDTSIPRFMGYLSLFTFFMLVLVCAPNLIQLFLGWEGVGLASYLLIGFWYQRSSANMASIKAFVTNRVGDAGFILGLAGLFVITGTYDIHMILTQIGSKLFAPQPFHFFGLALDPVTFVCIALFIGVMGKSAQLGFHTWLPDAMEGPTPVSALIHAATMVTAGVYLLIRLHPFFALVPHVQEGIAIIGAATCFFAATVALVQSDIKRVIAYSTCSQLGYMVMAAGMGAVDASFFHLITHAFFKALLFLGAGAVIHALSDEQDMDRMGGLYRYIPFSYAIMWIGSLALAGIPFFAGYYSKDSILVATFINPSPLSQSLYWIGIFVAFMTALYSWRLLLKVFHGEPRADDRVMAHIHEAPWVMRAPLIVLSLGAIFLGFIAEHYFVAHHDEAPSWVMQAPALAGFLGISFAFFFFFLKPHWAFYMSRIFKHLYMLFLNKWFFDKIYQRVFVQGALSLGRGFWTRVDLGIIDRFGPNGLAKGMISISQMLRRVQTGYIFHYAFIMMLGLVVIVFWVLYAGVLFK